VWVAHTQRQLRSRRLNGKIESEIAVAKIARFVFAARQKQRSFQSLHFPSASVFLSFFFRLFASLPPPSISIFIRINQRRQQRRQRIVVVCQLDSSGSAAGSAAAATPAEASDERTRPAAAAEFIRLWTFIRIRFWTFIRVTTDSG